MDLVVVADMALEEVEVMAAEVMDQEEEVEDMDLEAVEVMDPEEVEVMDLAVEEDTDLVVVAVPVVGVVMVEVEKHPHQLQLLPALEEKEDSKFL